MQKLLTSLAAAAALALAVSSAQAQCAFHNQQAMASNAQVEPEVSMSTHEDPATRPIVEDAAVTAPATECAAGETECVPAQK